MDYADHSISRWTVSAKTIVYIAIGTNGISISELLEHLSAIGISYLHTYEALLELVMDERIEFKGRIVHRKP